jgi:hypothetical protein
MQKILIAILIATPLLSSCRYFDTLEQAEGRCRKMGVGKLPAISGENSQATSTYLLSQYIDGCMAARGYHRDAKGKWVK